MSESEFQSRRTFLKRSTQLAISGTALPFALNLAAMGEAAAFNSTPGDYKALVCVFMFGGNDYANTVVPLDTSSYDLYSTIRGGTSGIALAKSSLLPLNPTTAPVDLQSNTRQFGLHPSMTGLAGLFNAGKAAVLLNVGPLVKPLTRVQYNGSNTLYPRPPQLFSHNDQQSVWQSSSPEGATTGWGGKASDLVLGVPLNSGVSTFSSMSVSGNAVFVSGNSAVQYQVSAGRSNGAGGGAIKIKPATDATVYGSSAVATAINNMLRETRTHKIEYEYNRVTTRALDAQTSIANALALTSETAPFTTVTFGTDNFSQQLQMVARLIKGRSAIGSGLRRQVFFVSLGGFDLHDNLIAQHPGLLSRVSAGLTAFHNAMVEIGDASKVTTFTASDFGRTLASNGDGSDHGWGSHHFIVGGAVNGKAFYGTPPPLSTSDAKDSGGVNYLPANAWHVGQGRLLPTTSVDQYAATLARWFGVDDSEMVNVLPNIANYAPYVSVANPGGFNLALPGGGTLNFPRYLGFV
ncbi:MAG: DUF1501 domain-containing protein [Betaproteobacteria bacterium]|nr:DUF1501 domain-containing protein [Betaproteobacteria bacterium]